ncbi:MAG TPA: hypothetical protein VEI97_15915 [bacterium]|nr:hypothetical protein [bacterium]
MDKRKMGQNFDHDPNQEVHKPGKAPTADPQQHSHEPAPRNPPQHQMHSPHHQSAGRTKGSGGED